MDDALLSGLKVLDASDGVCGGYCTKLLADMGAEVTKVEPPGSGDSTRRAGPFGGGVPNPETSAPFLYLNAGKCSVTLDLKSRPGQVIFTELATVADVVVENARPGVMEEWGLDYPALSQSNPSLVMASITWFGQTGPYRDYEGCDLVAHAVSGYMYLTGDEEREPLKAGGSQSEYQAGLAAAMAITTALSYRDLTGEGQYIDVSAIESLAATFDGVGTFTMEDRLGFVPRRAGTRLISRDSHSPYPSNLLPCQDGWVHVHWSPSFPEGLAFLTGNPRLESDEVMAALRGHADEIDAALTQWLKDVPREEVQAQAQEIRVPFTMVQSVAEVMEDPQNRATGFFAEVEHPVAGKLRLPTSPITTSAIRSMPKRAPLLGEHNEAVYCGTLGYAADELSRLAELMVI